jgi:hypothetical protein
MQQKASAVASPPKKREIQKSQPIGREVIVNKSVIKNVKDGLWKVQASRRGKEGKPAFFARKCCRLSSLV